jgi:hypothetical protein
MWLTGEEKGLCWEDGELQKTIVKGRKATFHLAFSQGNITRTQEKQIGSVYCEITHNKTQVHTWMATRNALQNPEYRDQDGLCQGEFKVPVEVFAENGVNVRSDFVIKVGDA